MLPLLTLTFSFPLQVLSGATAVIETGELQWVCLFFESSKFSSLCQHTQYSAHRGAVHQEEVDPCPI